jgi:hypothetical protein
MKNLSDDEAECLALVVVEHFLPEMRRNYREGMVFKILTAWEKADTPIVLCEWDEVHDEAGSPEPRFEQFRAHCNTGTHMPCCVFVEEEKWWHRFYFCLDIND